jgi:hypothetical protein
MYTQVWHTLFTGELRALHVTNYFLLIQAHPKKGGDTTMTEMQLKYLEHQEKVRHNLAAEALDAQSIDETARSNRAKEAESHRSNTASEQIDRVKAGLSTGTSVLQSAVRLIGALL